MSGRRPVLAGDRPVERVSTGREPDCYLCDGPLSEGQRMILTHYLNWVHLGCHIDAERVRAGSLKSFWRS